MKFILHGESVEFNDIEADEIQVFAGIYDFVFPIIRNNFEKEFINYSWKKKPNNYYDDEFDVCSEMEEELEELFVKSCFEIKAKFLKLLTDAGIYGFERSSVIEQMDMAFESAFQLVYRPSGYNGEDKLKLTWAYNKILKENHVQRLEFLHKLALQVIMDLKDIAMYEAFLDEHPDVEREKFGSLHSAFSPENYDEALIHNKIKSLRENIEEIGFNEKTKPIYIKTLEKDPFNTRTYFYLVDTLGDANNEVNELFTYVFGSDSVLQLYVDHIVRNKLSELYPKGVKTLKKIDDLSSLYSIRDKITELRNHYNAKYSTELEIEVLNKIVDLEEQQNSKVAEEQSQEEKKKNNVSDNVKYTDDTCADNNSIHSVTVRAEKPKKKGGVKKVIIIVLASCLLLAGIVIVGLPFGGANDTTMQSTEETSFAELNVADMYKNIINTGTIAGAQVTISDSSYDFIAAHPEFFPGNDDNYEDMINMLNWDASYKHISKNVDEYDNELARFVGYVGDIKEENIDGRIITVGYITYTDIHDTGLECSVLFLYDGSIDVYVGDSVELLILPLSNTSVGLTDGSKMDTIFGAAAYMKALAEEPDI